MANQALLDAVNKAIEALEEVRRELERENAVQPEAVATIAARREVTADPQPEQKAGPKPEEVKDEPQFSPTQAATQTAAGGVCPNCGNPVNPGVKFCMSCGTPIQAEIPAPSAPQGAFCLNCGAPLKLGDKFCMKCGTRVQ